MKCLKCQKTIKNKSFYGLHFNCFVEWFELEDLSNFSEIDVKYSSNYSSIEKTTDSFYHGRYRKYSAQLGGQQYILKVQESEYPDLPAMEYLCNKIASLLNLNVPQYYLIRYQEDGYDINSVDSVAQEESKKNQEDGHDISSMDSVAKEGSKKNQEEVVHASSTKYLERQTGLMTFVTRNFMQDYVGTLNHIYKYLPKGEKNYNCENIIKVINEQTGKFSDVEKFVEICLFDAFIGNNDRHGRNLGIIDTGRKKILAPMYDNPSFLGTQKDDEFLLAHFNPSGVIQTSDSKEPKPLDYIREFKRLKLEKLCFRFIQKIIDKFPVAVEEIKSAAISERRKKAFINLLTSRLKKYKQAMEEDFKNV